MARVFPPPKAEDCWSANALKAYFKHNDFTIEDMRDFFRKRSLPMLEAK